MDDLVDGVTIINEIWNTGGQGPSFAGVGEEKCAKELILDVLI